MRSVGVWRTTGRVGDEARGWVEDHGEENGCGTRVFRP